MFRISSVSSRRGGPTKPSTGRSRNAPRAFLPDRRGTIPRLMLQAGRRTRRHVVAVLSLGAAAFSSVASAPTFPAPPIRLIVPCAPGGSSAQLGRVVGAKLGEALGQTVVVDNRGGAGGSLG